MKGLPRLMVRSTTFGLGSKALHNFKMQFGVPAGWSVATQNPSSDVLGIYIHIHISIHFVQYVL